MGGLELLLSKGKPSKDETLDEGKGEGEDADADDKEAGLEDEYAGDIFDALKSGNRDEFIEALKNFKGC